jgi:hypothetical protein
LHLSRRQRGRWLRAAIARIRDEAEQAVRAGQSELFLTDENIGPDRMAIAMVLAAAAVHTHLVRKGLRSYASVNVRSAECLDTHYFAVLIGVGATTVNAYLAEASIADRHARGCLAIWLSTLRRALSHGGQRGPAQDHVQDGHRGDQQLSRRL